jgi:4-hydroxyphenylacetate 3-monooxygenase reductase component
MVQRSQFREAMAHMAAAVNVVTTDGVEGRCGYTCTAVCSVTDDPAIVLVCINRSSAMNPVFKKNGVFCINVLKNDQRHLSPQFAGMADIAMEDRFAADEWSPMPTGSPGHLHALCRIDCEIIEVKEMGTHSILFGRVVEIKLSDSDDEALIYVNRAYHAVPIGRNANI